MACIILFDPQNERAVFYDTVSERAVNHEAFIGPYADEQAEDFLAWEDFDPRSYPRGTYTLDDMIGLWRAEAFDENENYIGTQGTRRGDGTIDRLNFDPYADEDNGPWPGESVQSYYERTGQDGPLREVADALNKARKEGA